jgi:hypothetical protein
MAESDPAVHWQRLPEMEGAGFLLVGKGISLAIDEIGQVPMRLHYVPDAKTSGLSICYGGNRDDLYAAGCMPPGPWRYGRFVDDGHDGVWWLESKAWAKAKREVRLTYYTANRAFAMALPGVAEVWSDKLLLISPRPTLRLVVDNTR